MDYNKRSTVSTVPNSGPLRVGFVGLSVVSGWAIKTHYPAILQLSSQFRITAIYNPKLEDSLQTVSALKLNDATAFPTLESFASYTNVDMIVVTSPTSQHFSVLMPIIEISKVNKNLKYLFVEWPLTCTIEETELIYSAASKRGLQTIVGLQGRKSPYVLRAKELISQGYIGDINSIEIAGNGGWFGYERHSKIPSFIFDAGQGTDLVINTFGHTIDIVQYMTGSYFGRINSMIFNNIPNQELIDDNGSRLGKKIQKTVPDHLLFQGTLLKGNVPISCSIKGGKPTKKFTKTMVIDIHGTKGDIKLEGDAGFIEISNLVLYYNGVKYDDNDENNKNGMPNGYDSGKELTEVYHLRNYNAINGNVFRLYESVADFYFNTRNIPNLPTKFLLQRFEHEGFPTLTDGLILHRLIDNVYRSHSIGSTLNVGNISRL